MNFLVPRRNSWRSPPSFKAKSIAKIPPAAQGGFLRAHGRLKENNKENNMDEQDKQDLYEKNPAHPANPCSYFGAWMLAEKRAIIKNRAGLKTVECFDLNDLLNLVGDESIEKSSCLVVLLVLTVFTVLAVLLVLDIPCAPLRQSINSFKGRSRSDKQDNPVFSRPIIEIAGAIWPMRRRFLSERVFRMLSWLWIYATEQTTCVGSEAAAETASSANILKMDS